MHIEFDVPRPFLTLALIAGVVWAVGSVHTAEVKADVPKEAAPIAGERMENARPDAVGREKSDFGSDLRRDEWKMESETAENEVREDEQRTSTSRDEEGYTLRTDLTASVNDANLKSAWIEKEILERKEEIIRYELQRLEEERRILGDSVSERTEEEFREAARTLTGLMQSERALEQFLSAGLRQMLDAREFASAHARGGRVPQRLLCPLEHGCLVTAPFGDDAYKRIYHFDHTGTDFRSAQGSPVFAAAEGVVVSVQDNGLGFNSITIEHEGDEDEGSFATVYGHVSTFHVSEGDRVHAGELIADSGGLPGGPGTGLYSTGPHLHFEVYVNGEAVDSETFLMGLAHVQQ